MSDDRPILGCTMGDPAGIGPEITVATLAQPPEGVQARGIAIGDAAVARRAVEVCGLDVDVRVVSDVSEATFERGGIDVLDTGVLDEPPAFGEVAQECGRAAIAAIEAATTACLDGTMQAMVTAPIHKEAIWETGTEHLGHTEMLGELTGAASPETMFFVKELKIFFTTRHMSLADAVAKVDRDTVATAIDHSLTALRVLGHDEPVLAVAALNPHNGENGNFGRTELDAIGPACDAARDGGADVRGPIPGDSVFHQGIQGRFPAVLCHFHDQGHIAAKTVDFDGAVSVTMGLPIIRTSVDHGTAFDIAGSGEASAATMRSAFAAGARFAPYAERAKATYGP